MARLTQTGQDMAYPGPYSCNAVLPLMVLPGSDGPIILPIGVPLLPFFSIQ
ncbi:MAG: hypothetical protein AAFP02_05010 [Bacteroidota bacterium]